MKKTWEFLQSSIPEFKHPDESLPEKHQAAERDLRPIESPDLEKGNGLTSERQFVVCASYYPSQPPGSSCGTGLMVILYRFFMVTQTHGRDILTGLILTGLILTLQCSITEKTLLSEFTYVYLPV